MRTNNHLRPGHVTARCIGTIILLVAAICGTTVDASAQHFQLKYSTRIESVTPNPFDNREQSTEIKLVVVRPGPGHLAIYSIDGRQMVVLLNEELEVGTYTMYWNGRTRDGALAPSGTYLITFEVGDMKRTATVVIAR